MTLSILIATITERQPAFNMLRAWLMTQIIQADLEEEVEIVFLQDNKEISIGKKRQQLLEMAKGEFIAFVDDDDWTSDNYVKLICKAIKEHPFIDCVGFKGQMTVNGHNRGETFEGSIRHKEWSAGGPHYLRSPYHKNPVKRVHALAAGFEDMRFGEDHQYSKKLVESGLLKTEYFIDQIIYYYRYATNIPHDKKYGIK